MSLWYLLLSLTIALIIPFLASIRFHLGSGRFEGIPVKETVRAGYIGTMYSMVLPSVIGGDVIRLEIMKRSSNSTRRRIFFGLVIDRSWGLGGFGAILLCATIFIHPPEGYSAVFIISGIASILAAVSIQLVIRGREPDNETNLEILLIFMFGSIISGLTCILLTIVIALGLGVEWGDSVVLFVVMPLIWLVSQIPISIGGFGIREGGMVALLSLYGWEDEVSLGLGISTSLVLLVSSAVGLPIQWSQQYSDDRS
jgi:hypothetical protein